MPSQKKMMTKLKTLLAYYFGRFIIIPPESARAIYTTQGLFLFGISANTTQAGNPSLGDLWFDTSINQLYTWSNNGWVKI